MALVTLIAGALGTAAAGAVRSFVKSKSTSSPAAAALLSSQRPVSGATLLPQGTFFEQGADVEVVSDDEFAFVNGEVVRRKKRRRRRRRLLTCGDKADIAFLKGTLGQGAMAQTAIAAVMARCS